MVLVALQVEPSKLFHVNMIAQLLCWEEQAAALLLLLISFCWLCSSEEKSHVSAFRCTEVFLPNNSLSGCGILQDKM